MHQCCVCVCMCECQDIFKDDDYSPVWIKMHLMNLIALFRNLYVSTAAAAVCIAVIVVCLNCFFVLSFRFVFHTCIVYVSMCVCSCYPCVSVSTRLSLWQVILYCSSNCWLPVLPFRSLPVCVYARCWQKPAFVIWSRYTRICDRLKTILTFSHSISLSLSLSLIKNY